MSEVAEDSKPLDVVRFLVSIAGHGGPAVTLTCVLVNDEGVLVVAKDGELKETREDGFGMVANIDLPSVDYRFTNDMLRDAIVAYYARSAQGTIDLDSSMARHSPEHAIATDGIDERGPRYRLNPDITNGQIAVLAACAFCARQTPIASAMSMFDDLTTMYQSFSV